MLQVLEQDDFARENIAPENGIKKRQFLLRLSMNVGLNSSNSYLKNSAVRHLTYCPIGALNLETLLPLMAH